MKKFLISLFIVLIAGFFYFDFSDDNNGGEKVIPLQIETAAREALDNYPKLNDVNIRFEFKDQIGNNFMQALPEVSTLFKDAKKRTYLVRMTSEMEVDNAVIPVSEIPHEVLVGWFAHELGHVMDYLDRGWADMTWFGIKYWWSEEFKIEAERTADLFAIEHNCADQLICTKKYILNNSSLPAPYLQKIENFYLSPERVLEIVKEVEEEEL